METINDVSNFLNKMENAIYMTMEDMENYKRVKTVITNLFQDVNSEKLEKFLKNVRMIKTLIIAGDAKEVPDVVKILREDIKELLKEFRIKDIQNEV